MIALTNATTVTLSVAGAVVVIAVLVFLRVMLRRDAAGWRRFRVGFFVERDPPDEPPR